MKTQTSKVAKPPVVAPVAPPPAPAVLAAPAVATPLLATQKGGSSDCDYLSASKGRAEELANLEREYFREMSKKGKIGYIGAGTPMFPPLPLDKISPKTMAEIMSKIKLPQPKPKQSRQPLVANKGAKK